MTVSMIAAVIVMGAGAAVASNLAGQTPTATAFARPGYGLRGPSAAAVSGGRLWVANVLGNSLTELSAASGAHLRTLGPAAYAFRGPNAFAAGGNHVWVANVPANSVTEVNAETGRQERSLSSGYGFSSPYALALSGS